MNEPVINCPICGGGTSLIEQKKTLFRPQRFFHQCQSPACATKIKIDESHLIIDDSENKDSDIWKEFKEIGLSAEAVNSLAKRTRLISEGYSNRCNDCIHRKVKSICGNEAGPFKNIRINQKNHFCEAYAKSEALEAFGKGLLETIADNEPEGTRLFEYALERGIPEDDQVIARTYVADAYFRAKKLNEGLEQFDKALELDAKYEVKHFADKENRSAFFGNYDIVSTLVSDQIKEQEGIKEALRFLDKRIEMVDYLSGNILFKKYFFPSIWHHIGAFYLGKEDIKSAMKAFEKCEKAEYYGGNKVQENAKANAHEILLQYEIDKINEKRARRG